MINNQDQIQLLKLARESIEYGLRHGAPPALEHVDLPAPLMAPRATFVTLHHRGRLRGCIGTLTPREPLVDSVVHNAFNAAFKDPRFAPLSAGEWPEISLHIAALGPPSPIDCRDEADLLAQLKPGEDGLVLEDPPYHSTFLPAVWEQLPSARDFVRQLKRKAGLTDDHWSPTLRFQRYAVHAFGED